MRGSGGESHSQNVKFIGGRENEVESFLKSKDEFFLGGGEALKYSQLSQMSYPRFTSNERPALRYKDR